MSFNLEIARGLLAPIRNDFVLHRLIFVKSAKPGALNRRNMHKNVLSAARRSDEAIAFCWIEPFHGTASQCRLHSRKVENVRWILPTNTNTFSAPFLANPLLKWLSGRNSMNDYYAALLNAIGGLDDAGAQSRRSLYERAQTMLLGKLARRTPPPNALQIDEEFRSLANAIRKIESEFSRIIDEDCFARSRDILLKVLAAMPPRNSPAGTISTKVDHRTVVELVELL